MSLNYYDIQDYMPELYTKLQILVSNAMVGTNTQDIIDTVNTAFHSSSSEIKDKTQQIILSLVGYYSYFYMNPQPKRFTEITDLDFNNVRNVLKNMDGAYDYVINLPNDYFKGTTASNPDGTTTTSNTQQIQDFKSKFSNVLSYKLNFLSLWITNISMLLKDCSMQLAFDTSYKPVSNLDKETVSNIIFCKVGYKIWIEALSLDLDVYTYPTKEYYNLCSSKVL